MIPISRAFKAALQSHQTTFCTLWLVTQTNGDVFGFTDFNEDITYNGQLYQSGVGYVRSDIATSGDLSVDNLEVNGIIDSPSIDEPDLAAGLWDFAAIRVSLVNWTDFTVLNPIAILRGGSVATAYGAVPSTLQVGDSVLVAGADQSAYNGVQTVTAVNPGPAISGYFQYTVVGTPTTPATGSITWQTQMGELIYRTGTLGEVTLQRGTFVAELRGLTQAYTRTIGQLTSPMCRTTLGSPLCTIDLTPFTFTATVTGVNPSESIDPAQQRTFYATALTQPGPSGGIAITAITQANPGEVTLASSLGLPNGSPITISGVVGMTNVNTNTYAESVSGNVFYLPDDTSSFPAYISGGTVTPLGGTSGYFDNGVVTWTGGDNAGLSMEVQSYVPGQVILFSPMPYEIQIGDTFSIHAGCDYSFSTCKNRFSNQLNFRGEPYVPGVDQIVQVGKQGG